MRFLRISSKFTIIGLLFIFSFLFSSFFARIGVDPHHDGIMLKPALDVAFGKTLYTQTYTHYGIVTVLIQSLSIIIGGPYLLSIRLITSLFYALSTILLWLIWSKFLSKQFTILTIVIWHLLAPYLNVLLYPWSDVYALFFLLVTMYLFLRLAPINIFKARYNNLLMFFMGITSSLSFYSKQSYITLAFSISLYFITLIFLKAISWKKAAYYLVSFLTGIIFISSLVFIWIIINHALPDFWIQTFRVAYTNTRIQEKSFSLLRIFLQLLHQPLWILLPLSTFILLVQSIIKRNITLIGCSFILLSSLIHYFPNYEVSHLYWAATPIFGFFIYQILIYTRSISFNKVRSYIYLIFILISVFSIVQALIQNTQSGVKKAMQPYVFSNVPRALYGMKLEYKQTLYYSDIDQKLLNFFRLYPDRKFVNNTEEALYLTFTDKAINMGPLYANFSGYTSGFYPFGARLDAYIQSHKPLIISYEQDKYRWTNYHPLAIWQDYQTILLAPDP